MKIKTVFTFILLVVFFNCSVMKKEKIEIRGIAKDAKLGAIVVSEENDTPYYLDGIKSWPKDTNGESVIVTGFLSVIEPTQDENPLKPKVKGQRKIILKPKWIIFNK